MNLKKDETNNAIICKLCNVRPHSNADRLKLATVLGTQVIVGLESQDGDLVIYFDSNLRLSHNYLHYNNLYSNPELNSDTTKKGYFSKTGSVRAQKFRGEVSNGYVAELSSIDRVPGTTIEVFEEGDEFVSINGIEICSKYLPLTKSVQGKPRPVASKMFHKHWDTKQLMRELDSVSGVCYIEEKIHGTSGRTGHVLCEVKRGWKFWKPKEEWKVISGTRRVDDVNYHLPAIRKEIERQVAPHLHKGEQIYYEIYGYDGGKEIQPEFHYDCRPGEFKVLLYRVTITTPDGFCIDLDREQVYRRADELGLECPVLFDIADTDWEWDDDEFLISWSKGKSALDVGTLREGIVCWFKDKGKWIALKHKSEEFLLSQDKLIEKGNSDVEDIL